MASNEAQERLLEDTEDPNVPLETNELWADVTPIPQDDGPDTVVNIAYYPNFTEGMNYFRAVLQSGEISLRVFCLMKRIIALNAANYTAWHVRRKCLEQLDLNLEEELEYIDECIEGSSKNYQVWNHRRVVIEMIGDGSREPQFVAQVLNDTDAKNYHAWAHRQWAVKRFGLWEGELEFTDFLIKDDVRNNSAWNHRWFVVTKGGTVKTLDEATTKREFSYVMSKTELAVSNECPYNYMRALCKASSSLKLSSDDVLSWLEDLLVRYKDLSSLVALRSLLLDAVIEAQQLPRAMQLCLELANVYDSIRSDYWRWRANVVAEGIEAA